MRVPAWRRPLRRPHCHAVFGASMRRLRLPENRGVPSSILGLAIQVLERSQRFGVGVQAVALLPEEGSIGATPASRASGDRRLNSALHKIAVRRGRWEPRARAYLEHRRAEGQARREALRCLKPPRPGRVPAAAPGKRRAPPAGAQGPRRQGPRPRACLRRPRSWCSCPPDRTRKGATLGGLSTGCRVREHGRSRGDHGDYCNGQRS
jgi:hypothetical protein